MPVTKTAKRALRSSANKADVNSMIKKALEIAIRTAEKVKSAVKVGEAVSLVDRASKKKVIHKNKAARIKSRLSKLGGKPATTKKAAPKKAVKTSKAKKVSKK